MTFEEEKNDIRGYHEPDDRPKAMSKLILPSSTEKQMQDMPADIKKIVDENWNELITENSNKSPEADGAKGPVNIIAVMEQLDKTLNARLEVMTFLKEDWDDFKTKVLNHVTDLRAERDKWKEMYKDMFGENQNEVVKLKAENERLKERIKDLELS